MGNYTLDSHTRTYSALINGVKIYGILTLERTDELRKYNLDAHSSLLGAEVRKTLQALRGHETSEFSASAPINRWYDSDGQYSFQPLSGKALTRYGDFLTDWAKFNGVKIANNLLSRSDIFQDTLAPPTKVTCSINIDDLKSAAISPFYMAHPEWDPSRYRFVLCLQGERNLHLIEHRIYVSLEMQSLTPLNADSQLQPALAFLSQLILLEPLLKPSLAYIDIRNQQGLGLHIEGKSMEHFLSQIRHKEFRYEDITPSRPWLLTAEGIRACRLEH